MENVYNIRLKKYLYFVLPDSVRNNADTVINKGEMAVIIHLHYEDTVDKYFNYICNIPMNVDVYISVSEEKTKLRIEENMERYHLQNCRIVEKKNRGRDISALLVACREIAMRYEYICFLHDKKEKKEYLREYTEEWISLMWENTIASEEFIYNIKDVFEKHKDIGILAVPEPFGMRENCAFDNAWYSNFDKTVDLAHRLKLNSNIDPALSPITVGTAFWARAKALGKLLSYHWCYEDFAEEPLPDDGTINHAVERILAYVAQDAGYYTGAVRTIKCAEKHICDMQHLLKMSFERMDELGIGNIDDVVNYERRKEKCRSFFEKYEEVYLYGAGKRGERILRFLRLMGLQPKAFLVTSLTSDFSELNGVPIKELGEISLTEKVGIIITVNIVNKDEIIESLEEKNFHNYMWLLGEENENISMCQFRENTNR